MAKFEKNEIIEVKGLKFKVKQWTKNGRLNLKLVGGHMKGKKQEEAVPPGPVADPRPKEAEAEPAEAEAQAERDAEIDAQHEAEAEHYEEPPPEEY